MMKNDQKVLQHWLLRWHLGHFKSYMFFVPPTPVGIEFETHIHFNQFAQLPLYVWGELEDKRDIESKGAVEFVGMVVPGDLTISIFTIGSKIKGCFSLPFYRTMIEVSSISFVTFDNGK
jgi:hypothetical protein